MGFAQIRTFLVRGVKGRGRWRTDRQQTCVEKHLAAANSLCTSFWWLLPHTPTACPPLDPAGDCRPPYTMCPPWLQSLHGYAIGQKKNILTVKREFLRRRPAPCIAIPRYTYTDVEYYTRIVSFRKGVWFSCLLHQSISGRDITVKYTRCSSLQPITATISATTAATRVPGIHRAALGRAFLGHGKITSTGVHSNNIYCLIFTSNLNNFVHIYEQESRAVVGNRAMAQLFFSV